MSYALAADVTVVAHAAFIVFVISGQVFILLGWWKAWEAARNLVFRVAHVTAIGFVVLEAWFGVTCPLTVAENQLRELAGEAGVGPSFIGHWLGRLIFYNAPGWIFTVTYTAFAAVVVVSLFGYPPQRSTGAAESTDST